MIVMVGCRAGGGFEKKKKNTHTRHTLLFIVCRRGLHRETERELRQAQGTGN